MNSFNPVDTDEVEKRPDERNEDQRAPRSTFCPLQPSPMRGSVCVSVVKEDSWVQVCVCVLIYSVVSDLHGLPEGPDKCFNRPNQHGFVLPSTTSACPQRRRPCVSDFKVLIRRAVHRCYRDSINVETCWDDQKRGNVNVLNHVKGVTSEWIYLFIVWLCVSSWVPYWSQPFVCSPID